MYVGKETNFITKLFEDYNIDTGSNARLVWADTQDKQDVRSGSDKRSMLKTLEAIIKRLVTLTTF
jgi:hypothetical protein